MKSSIYKVFITILIVITLGLIIYAYDQKVEARWQYKNAKRFADSIYRLHETYDRLRGDEILQGNFAALIVDDIDISVSWYRKILGFDISDSTINRESGLKLYNLRHGITRLELIEISSALDPAPGRIKGIFKIGYSVANFDEKLEAMDLHTKADVVVDPFSGKRMMVVNDPDGNRIQLFEK